jgi:hypothetical protein
VCADGGANRVFDGMPELIPDEDPAEVRERWFTRLSTPSPSVIAYRLRMSVFDRMLVMCLIECDTDDGELCLSCLLLLSARL